MDIKEYISSGIVESYVLGLASPEEITEFEKMCDAHTEVRAARYEFELQLERSAVSVGIIPPRQLKSKIVSEIEIANQKNGHTQTLSHGATRSEAPVRSAWWKYVAAASIILLVASTILNFYFFNKVRNYSEENARLISAQTELAKNNDQIKKENTAYENAMNIVKDPNMAVIPMKGVENFPSNLATVYWDRRTKDVFLMVNNLAAPGQGKQYQLWAIQDGKPVDAGILNWQDSRAFAKMKNIPAAQAFAITLEKAGGSPSPTMEEMRVMGTL